MLTMLHAVDCLRLCRAIGLRDYLLLCRITSGRRKSAWSTVPALRDIPAELAELGCMLGAALTRAQYLALLEREVATPDQFELAEAAGLADCLGVTENRALELQETVHNGKRQEAALAPLLPPPTE
jgi:hypothetical protein